MSASQTLPEATLPADGARLIAFPQTDEQRLRVALRKLEAALDEQALAVADFRAAMGELGSAVQGLEASALDYRDSLDDLAEQAEAAHQAALQLDETAEEMLARV